MEKKKRNIKKEKINILSLSPDSTMNIMEYLDYQSLGKIVLSNKKHFGNIYLKDHHTIKTRTQNKLNDLLKVFETLILNSLNENKTEIKCTEEMMSFINKYCSCKYMKDGMNQAINSFDEDIIPNITKITYIGELKYLLDFQASSYINLKEIHTSSNQIVAWNDKKEVPRFTNITKIKLSFAKLNIIFINNLFKNNPSLEEIHLDDTKVSDWDKFNLPFNCNIKKINLRATEISYKTLSEILNKARNLEEIILSSCLELPISNWKNTYSKYDKVWNGGKTIKKERRKGNTIESLKRKVRRYLNKNKNQSCLKYF